MRAARQRGPVFRRRRRAVFRGAARRGQVPRRLNVSSDGYSENGGRYRVYVNVPRGNGSQTSAGDSSAFADAARPDICPSESRRAQAELMPAGYAGYHHRD